MENNILLFIVLISLTRIYAIQQPSKLNMNSRRNNICFGRDGRDGPPGPMGRDGRDGKDGKDGKDGSPGKDGEPGKAGEKGKNGIDGKNGKDGSNGRDGVNGKDGAPGKDALPKNWKECAWNKLNNGHDNGEIKNCSFNKQSLSTYLEVSVTSNMQISGCNGCCKRWYVTFDGAECSPVPIDVVVYMANQDGKFGNLHRPRIIKGYCKIQKSGLVSVGFRVGNCHGYRNANAYTGWNSSTRIMIEEVDPPQS